MPASASARSSSFPAGPTNGWPLRSSASPGCSPTSISGLLPPPSPKTVCVPRLYRSQALHCFAAARTFAIVGRSGISSAADRGFGGGLGIGGGNRDVPAKAGGLGPAHGASMHRAFQILVAHRFEGADLDLVPLRARLPRRIARDRRPRVPRTYFLADVAAIHMRPYVGLERRGNLVAQL